MKVHEKCLAVLLALVGILLLSACTGSSEGPSPAPVVTATASPEETPTATASAEAPTATPPPAVTGLQRIDAVIAQLEADVAAGDIPSVFAYDLLDSQVNDEGDVTLTICAWAGDSVFDQVRDSIYRTKTGADGTITASHVTTPIAAGECLNTQLIESALDHINEFEQFVIEAGEDPSIYATDERRSLLSEEYEALSAEGYQGFVDAGISFRDLRPAGGVTGPTAAEILWRRLTTNGVSIFEVGVCRDMIPTRGMFRDGVLLDDERDAADPGLHSIDSFQLMPDSSDLGTWLISGQKAVIWSDCFFAGSWPEGANIFQPRDTSFEVLER